ncbi:MAG: hypothetical protein ACFFBD_10930 [Candidatus Hodarchaeota archaeon]
MLRISIPVFVLLLFFAVSSSIVAPAAGFSKFGYPPGFLCSNFDIVLDLTDNQIASFWSSVDIYENVSEFGTEGYAKFANNRTHIFALLVCSQDSEWISIEFEATDSTCMKNLNDGWSFYIDDTENSVQAKDVSFVGAVIPTDDVKNDLSIEYIFSGDLVFIEVVRSFDTQDSDGYDLVYQNTTLVDVIFASKANHFGSHILYFLYVQIFDTEGTGTPPPTTLPTIPTRIDLFDLKFGILALSIIGVVGFIVVNSLRLLIVPIKHKAKRIIDSSWKSPSLGKRWQETFGKEV